VTSPDVTAHSVTYHPTQVNLPRLNPSQASWHKMISWRDWKPSWPRWLATYRDGLPTHRQSVTHPSINRARRRSKQTARYYDNLSDTFSHLNTIAECQQTDRHTDKWHQSTASWVCAADWPESWCRWRDHVPSRVTRSMRVRSMPLQRHTCSDCLDPIDINQSLSLSITQYHPVSSAVMMVKSKSKTTTFCQNRPRSKLWSLQNHCYDLFLQRLLDVAALNCFTIIIVIVVFMHVGGQWVTLTFDLAFRRAFCWAKVRLSPDLSQKVKWFR